MAKYLFIETRHLSESRDVEHTYELAANLAARANEVTTFLTQTASWPPGRGRAAAAS